MLSFNRWQIGTIVAVLLLGLYFLAPNRFAKENEHVSAETLSTIDQDSQSGSYLLIEVDTDHVLEARALSLLSDVRYEMSRVEDALIKFDKLTIEGDSIIVPIIDPTNMDEAFKRLESLSRPVGGLLSGGGRDLRVTRDDSNNRITLTMTEEAQEYYANEAVADSIDVVRLRIDTLGTTEPQIARQGLNRFVVQVPGDSDSAGLQSVINRTGRLTFHLVDETADPSAALEPGYIRVMTTDGVPLVLVETPEMTGDMVVDASATPDQENGGFQVNFTFDGRGAKRFRDVTVNNVGRTFAIVLDDEVISYPRIQSPITGGAGRITAQFSPEEANELAVLIRSGALPAPLTIIEERNFGPDTAADNVGDRTRPVVKEEKK